MPSRLRVPSGRPVGTGKEVAIMMKTGIMRLAVICMMAMILLAQCVPAMAEADTRWADAADEIMGLDRSEHGLTTAYSGFSILPEEGIYGPEAAPMPAAAEAAGTVEAAPAAKKPAKAPDEPVYTRVQIICRPASLESLKTAMNRIGITGMTVTNVMGYGMQKGKPEYYRGTPVEVTLLPKVQVDIVVSKVPVSEVIDTARKVLYTGHIGDGKIFVHDVEDVVRVRTGETGYDALQSEDE